MHVTRCGVLALQGQFLELNILTNLILPQKQLPGESASPLLNENVGMVLLPSPKENVIGLIKTNAAILESAQPISASFY